MGTISSLFLFFEPPMLQKVNSKLTMLERQRFGKDSPPIRVAIVGCGYSGVELAATISERLEDRGVIQAINVETAICPNAPPGNREAALRVSIHIKYIFDRMQNSWAYEFVQIVHSHYSFDSGFYACSIRYYLPYHLQNLMYKLKC